MKKWLNRLFGFSRKPSIVLQEIRQFAQGLNNEVNNKHDAEALRDRVSELLKKYEEEKKNTERPVS